jgi:predicted O-methyltransferase YrrM
MLSNAESRPRLAKLRTVYLLVRSVAGPPWPGYGRPFNGQEIRQQTIVGLLESYRPDSCIETGTLFGFTTQYLAELGVPVFSIEVDPTASLVARLRLRGHRNVKVIHGDSRRHLQALAENSAFRRPFIYLDAHWGGKVPLAAELKTILASWPDALIVIDDCRVPAFGDYGYYVYDGEAISLENLDLGDDVLAAYPAVPAERETGGKQGTLYLGYGPDAKQAIDTLIGLGSLEQAR